MDKFIISKNLVIADVIKNYPQTRRIFKFYSIDRTGCGWGGYSKLTIEQAALMRKIDVDKLIIKLNKSIKG